MSNPVSELVLLTHCILVGSSSYMLDESVCHFRGVGPQ